MQILQEYPEHPEAQHNLGILYVQQGDMSGGLQLLQEVLQNHPTQQQHWFSYINTLIALEQWEAAAEVIGLAGQHGIAGPGRGCVECEDSARIDSSTIASTITPALISPGSNRGNGTNAILRLSNSCISTMRVNMKLLNRRRNHLSNPTLVMFVPGKFWGVLYAQQGKLYRS